MFELLLLLIQRIGLIVTIAFIMTRSSTFRNLIDHKPDRVTKVKLAILFGFFGIVGTYTGIAVAPDKAHSSLWISDVIELDFDEAIANSRVVGVVIGGLLGGPAVGVGAGLIAGIHRMLLGGFTGLACAISTVAEGLIAGFVFRRSGVRRIITTKEAFMTGFAAETIQMIIILIVAKPFIQALALVEVIGIPMIIANSIGIAIFIAITRSVVQEEDRIEANQAQKVLHIANQTLVHLRKGLNEESATGISKLLLKTTGVSAVSITDREKILSHVGLGDDHHTPGHTLLTKATKLVMNTASIYVAKSLSEINCEEKKCPLQAAIIVPLKQEEQVVGVLKFYFANPKQIRPVDKELAEGIGKLLSNQLEAVEAEKQAKLVSEAEIKALQAQVNPHFLFNSLNTIVALIRTKPDMARKLLIQLGHFFRQNLNASLHALVTLRQEIEHTKAYLDIEQARFSDRLKIDMRVDEELEQVNIPPLTLQPLVENAIKHGLNKIKHDGLIVIEAIREDDFVKISISDNGIGIPEERLKDLLHKKVKSQNGTGFGLYNVHHRLIGMFGKDSGLHIDKNDDNGTTFWFLIPIHYKVAEEK